MGVALEERRLGLKRDTYFIGGRVNSGLVFWDFFILILSFLLLEFGFDDFYDCRNDLIEDVEEVDKATEANDNQSSVLDGLKLVKGEFGSVDEVEDTSSDQEGKDTEVEGEEDHSDDLWFEYSGDE